MKFFQYRFVLIAGLIVLAFSSYFFWGYDNQNNGIYDYNAARDKQAIKKMFHDDWKMLYFGDFDKMSEDDFNVDFLLDNASSSQYLALHDSISKVLRVDGKTVGFLNYYPKSDYWWHMHFLIVDQEYRNKGYASKLVQYFIDDAVARGAVKVSTFTRVVNAKARAVYQGKFGFKAITYPVGHHYENYLDLVLYPKKNK